MRLPYPNGRSAHRHGSASPLMLQPSRESSPPAGKARSRSRTSPLPAAETHDKTPALPQASCASSNWQRGAWCGSFIGQRLDSRQLLALEELKRRAATRRDVGDVLLDARGMDRRDRVTAAD